MPDDENNRFLNAVADALEALDPGSIPTKFIVIVDYMDANGQRSLWTSAGPNATPWDTLGMLEFARNRELAALVQDDNTGG